MSRRMDSCTMVITLLMVILTSVKAAHSGSTALQVYNIDTDLRYEAIQEAINAYETLDGHTILVDAGVYYENVVVNKSLTLIANDRRTIIDGNTSGVVVSVVAENVTIEGFTIRNGGDTHSGISLFSSVNSIVNNSVTNCWCGIRLENTTHNLIANNTITDNLNGISGELWSENTVIGNSIANNLIGIGMGHYSMRNTIIFNDIRNHWDHGISMSESYQNIVAKNNILANNQGGHWAAIYLEYSSYNEIFHNNIVNKGNQTKMEEEWKNIWDDDYPSGGNYWSNYNGSDLYSGPFQNETGSDGIGDTPHTIGSKNEDRYPLMEPYPLPDMGRIYNEFFELLASFIEIQSTYEDLKSNYDRLNASFNSLQSSLNDLQAEHDYLQSKFNSLSNELNATRNVMYTLLISAMILATTTVTVYLATRKPE